METVATKWLSAIEKYNKGSNYTEPRDLLKIFEESLNEKEKEHEFAQAMITILKEIIYQQ